MIDRNTAGNDQDSWSSPGLRPPKRFGEGAVSGAVVIIGAKMLGLIVSFVALAIIARLLTPADFGLVAMVLSVTALLMVFSDLGLSYVTVQRPQISQEQLSTLFWINVGFGLLLGLITAVMAPGLVWFYWDPRLLEVTIALAAAFPLAALGVQHQALLRRHMKFRRLAFVRLSAAGIAALAGIAAAYAGYGYWALVYQSLALASAQSAGAWVSIRWRPGWPRRCQDLGTMLGFGGRLTAHGIVGYLSTNLDKVLLGRFCGALALGLYATSYRLMTKSLGATGVTEVAISSMARAAQSQDTMRTAYRRMFQFLCLLGMPVCLAGVIWADDVVLTLLGTQWMEATTILRLLFAAAIPRMVAGSTGWIYVATGRPGRMLRWELMWSPTVALAFVVGLSFGANGVAAAYALAHWFGCVPCLAYCFRGTDFRIRDVLEQSVGPILCSLISCTLAVVGQMAILIDAPPGSTRLAFRLCLATALYGASTVIFVPLAGEALRKVTCRLRQVFVSVHGRVGVRGLLKSIWLS